MSVDEGYATCGVCRHVYRPGSADSVEGHQRATGHAPTRGGVPSPPPTGEVERVTPAQLLVQAASRLEELQAVVDGLDELATSWEASPIAHRNGPGLREAAAMLRGYLARPPIHAQDEEPADA